MLSQKYLTIKKYLTEISKIDFLHKKLVVLAQMYVDIDKGFRFSYISDENGELEFINSLNRQYKGKFVYFDVGAHFGTYTDMMLERFENYEGHLFEPTKATYEECISRHGKNEKLIINNAALSEKEGQVEYRVYPDDPTRNGIAGVGPESHLKYELNSVPCWTGDKYCQSKNITHIHLLKIDAEGYDLHVIKGFDEMLTKGQIDIVQFEYNVKHGDTHAMMGDFYAYLESKGYILGPIRQEGVKFEPFEFQLNDFRLGPNYVACRPELRGFLSKF